MYEVGGVWPVCGALPVVVVLGSGTPVESRESCEFCELRTEDEREKRRMVFEMDGLIIEEELRRGGERTDNEEYEAMRYDGW